MQVNGDDESAVADAGLSRQRLVGSTAAVMLLAVTGAISIVSGPGNFPPNFSLTASFVAAALLSVRLTVLVAAAAASQSMLLAWFYDDYRGGAFAGRVVFAMVAAAIAVGLAVARTRREAKLAAAQVDLRQANLLRTLAETSGDPMFVKDREGRYQVANDATAASLGRARGSELIGRRDRDLVSSEVADWIEADDQRVFRSGLREEFEDVLDVGAGPRVYLTHKNALRDDEGFVVGLTAVAKDITVRREAERNLARSEHRFRSLVEASSAVVWRTDADLTLADSHAAWSGYTGQSAEEQAGRGWLTALHQDDRPTFVESWRRASARRSPFEMDARLWHAPSGGHRHVTTRAIPLVGPDDEIEEWIGTFTDVHDRVVAEHRIERAAAVRRMVAEAASRVAVASAPELIAREALAVLTEHLPPHSGSVILSEPDQPARWDVIAFSGLQPRVAEEWVGARPDIRVPVPDVVRERRALQYSDVADYKAAYPDLAPALERADIEGQTFLVPLSAGRETLGALALSFYRRVDDTVAQSTSMALDELAPIIGHSLNQAQFLELEARIASSFQQAMLEVGHDSDPCLEVATMYQAGSVLLEAGGDWFDVVRLNDGRIGLTVGDVVGRSLRAATVMGRLRAAMRALVLTLGEPASVLMQLDAVVDTIEDAQFATCTCVIIDPARSSLTYSTAGHPPPLLVPRDERATYLEEAQGPPLGIRPARMRRSAVTRLAVGSRLVLYTDGLVERRREPLDAGLDRLVDAAERARETPVDAMPAEVSGVLFADYEQKDDVAMVCAELISESRERFQRCLDADPAGLRGVRSEYRHWLAADGTNEALVGDALLAIGEALANAVEHGRGGPQSIDLELRRVGERLDATIRDRGRWRDRRVDPTRGRGLQIMGVLAESVAIDRTATGTIVTMELPLGATGGE